MPLFVVSYVEKLFGGLNFERVLYYLQLGIHFVQLDISGPYYCHGFLRVLCVSKRAIALEIF